ncbi:hypothetical protein LTS18_004956, partial [Coniosporium uncinatum]
FLEPTIESAEDIVLLHLLQPVMTLPFENPVSDALVHRGGYTLPFDRERRLASILAFLSSTKDDPKHIPAVCVAEDAESKSLNVMLAVNKTNPQDGNQALQQLEKGFEGIFQVLSQLQFTSAKVQNDVFAAIVGMCSNRILCRLGFVATSRNVVKQSIKTLLQDTIRSLDMLGAKQSKTRLPLSGIFVQRAKGVIKMVDVWTKHRTMARLGDLVTGVYHLGQIGGIDSVLAAIPNASMDPNVRKRLLNIIDKTGRYKDAARFLYRTAKKYPAARQMRVVLVALPPELYQSPGVRHYDPTLLSTLSRFRGEHGQRDLDQICSLLKSGCQDPKAQYAQRARRTARKAKIHAEIQLLYHYEIEPSTLPPRVVCSSKDACYICNSFILMHGKMHTPRCHGRIYPGWGLPFLPVNKTMEKRFIEVLETLVKSSLDSVLSNHKRIKYPNPNESTLLTLPASMSTVICVVEHVVMEGTPVTPVVPVQNVDTESDFSHLHPQPVPMLSETTPVAKPVAASACEPLEPTTRLWSVPALDNGSISSDSTPYDHTRLAQGYPLLGRTESGTVPRSYTVGPLELIIEHSTGSARGKPSHAHKNLSYSIEWLESNHADSLQQLEGPLLIDAESFEGEVTYNVEKSFFVTGRGAVVKIVYSEMS